MIKKKPAATPDPAPPAPPEKGKLGAAVLEELKTIRSQNERILAALTPKQRRTVKNMYGEDVPADEEE